MNPSITTWLCSALCIALATVSNAAEQRNAPAAQLTNSQQGGGGVVGVRALLDSWRGDPSVLEEARARLDRILLDDPKSAAAYREYARYHIMAGFIRNDDVIPRSLTAAEQSLKTALRLNPNYAEAYVLAGHLYFLQRRNTEAKAALVKAEGLGTSDPWLHNNWADILMAEGKSEEAASRYQRVIDSGTRNAKAMTSAFDGLVHYYQRTGRLADAETMYRRKIAYEPGTAWSYGNYAAFLLCRKDDADAAIRQFKTALGLMNYGVARAGLAAALYRQWAAESSRGQREEAGATLSEAMRLRPGDPVDVVESFCGSGPAVTATREATAQVPLR